MEDKTTVICPHCQKKYSINVKYNGKIIECNSCREKFKIDITKEEGIVLFDENSVDSDVSLHDKSNTSLNKSDRKAPGIRAEVNFSDTSINSKETIIPTGLREVKEENNSIPFLPLNTKYMLLPEKVTAILRKMVMEDPEERYFSLEEVLQDFKNLNEKEKTAVSDKTLKENSDSKGLKGFLIFILLLLSLSVALFFWINLKSPSKPEKRTPPKILKPQVETFLKIDSIPPGAEVFLDNVFTGITPLKINFTKTGEVVLLLKKKGYKIGNEKFTMETGVSLDKTLSLEPEKLSESVPLPSSVLKDKTSKQKNDSLYEVAIHSRDMVLIKGGCFKMGSNEGNIDEKPEHIVCLRNFYIDKSEVTTEAYQQCVEAGKCKEPETSYSHKCNYGNKEKLRHPVNCINWYMAKKFCVWKNRELPSEAQWQFAAKGNGKKVYPWGNQVPDCSKTNFENCQNLGTVEVCANTKGNTSAGICDLSGNLHEWANDWYDEEFYSKATLNDPVNNIASAEKVILGGSWSSNAEELRVTARFMKNPSDLSDTIGFRCVINQ